MQQQTIKLLVSTGTLLVALLFSQISAAADESNFRVAADGSVRIGGQSYADMRAYLQSEQFRERGGRCATNSRSQIRAPLTQRQPKSPSDCSKVLTVIKDEYQPKLIFTIPIWFHVIQTTSGVGAISNSRINQQIQVLNEDFQAISGTIGELGVDAKFEFELAGITRTTNNEWYTDSFDDETAYKTALVKDPNKFLNVYTNDADGFLGYAYFPQDAAGAFFDGVVMLSGSIGGRNNGFGAYDQGRTLVHEIGHYLALYHTFEGGNACQNSFSTGDLITDTNAESEPYYGTPSGCISRTTCGSPDPVDNYMDYNVDSCMTRFTEQQVNRMICAMVNFRPGFVSMVDASGSIVPVLNYLLNEED